MNSQSLHEQLKPKEYQERSGDDDVLRCRRYCGVRPAPPKNHRGRCGFLCGAGPPALKQGVEATVIAIKVQVRVIEARRLQHVDGEVDDRLDRWPVSRFERSHVGAQALESLRRDAHHQLIVARVQGQTEDVVAVLCRWHGLRDFRDRAKVGN